MRRLLTLILSTGIFALCNSAVNVDLTDTKLIALDNGALNGFEMPAPHALNVDVFTHELRAWFSAPHRYTPPTPRAYVARIPNATVSGPLGDVVDDTGEIFLPLASEPTNGNVPSRLIRERHSRATKTMKYDKLLSVVHSYNYMTFHFMFECLPKLVQALPLLGQYPEMQVLVWGPRTDIKVAWLQIFNVSESRIVWYDLREAYHANELYFPSPGRTGQTARELLQDVVKNLKIPSTSRDHVVYVSRKGSASGRRMTNEDQLIDAITQAIDGQYNLRVYNGWESPSDVLVMFARARAVIGFHGAGLVNSMFSAPGTPVIEMIFTHHPHLDFYNLAGVFGHAYWMVPVPQSMWITDVVEAPIGQVIGTLVAALHLKTICPVGARSTANNGCDACPKGSIGVGGEACWECPGGWWAHADTATTCHICPLGTVSSPDKTTCVPCPAGHSTILPGASACIPAHHAEAQREEINPMSAMLLKMLPPVLPRPDDTASFRRVLTWWEWTVFGWDTEAHGLPSDSRWRSLITSNNCSGDAYETNCTIPAVTYKYVSLRFQGVDFARLSSDIESMNEFKQTIIQVTATTMNISPSLVDITNVRPGSVIVELQFGVPSDAIASTINQDINDFVSAATTYIAAVFPAEFIAKFKVTGVEETASVDMIEPAVVASSTTSGGLSYNAKLGIGLGSLALGIGCIIIVGIIVKRRRARNQIIVPI